MTEAGERVIAQAKLIVALKRRLAACAYWAANGLHSTFPIVDHGIMLRNILEESKKYAESEPGLDNNILYDGFEYSYTPVGGWFEPEKEPMD